jgi:ER-bound oxygenase mpaB/B'/Rubber oxygenase, catalytic domain
MAPPSSSDRVQARLRDTGAFVLSVLVDPLVPPSAPDLAGCCGCWTMALQVRVLHAKVRRALLRKHSSDNNNKNSATRQEKRTTRRTWDVEALGVPINQDDMAATLLGFSYNAMLGSEFILGFGMQWSRQEQLDYLHLWRYLGWLLGVDCYNCDDDDSVIPLDPCGPGFPGSEEKDPLKHANSVFFSMLRHLVKPDERSIKIATHLLRIGGTYEKDHLSK